MDEFNKFILDLENINVQIDDEDQLCSLPKMHNNFKETLIYRRKTLSLEKAQVALSSSALNEMFEVNASSVGDDLVARGRPHTSDNSGYRKRSKLRKKNGGNRSSIRS